MTLRVPSLCQSAENHRLNGKLTELHDEHNKLKAAHAELQDAHHALKNKPDNTIEVLRTEIRELKAKLDALAGIEKEKEDLENELYEKEKEFEAFKEDLKHAHDEEERLRGEVERLQKEIDHLLARGADAEDIKELEVNLASTRNGAFSVSCSLGVQIDQQLIRSSEKKIHEDSFFFILEGTEVEIHVRQQRV